MLNFIINKKINVINNNILNYSKALGLSYNVYISVSTRKVLLIERGVTQK